MQALSTNLGLGLYSNNTKSHKICRSCGSTSRKPMGVLLTGLHKALTRITLQICGDLERVAKKEWMCGTVENDNTQLFVVVLFLQYPK